MTDQQGRQEHSSRPGALEQSPRPRWEWPLQLIWLPVPVFIIAAVLLWPSASSRRTIESLVLLATLNTLFCASVSFLTAYLAAALYVRTGSRALLLLGCGSLAFGVSYLVVGILMGDHSTALVVHNMGVFVAGACFLASASLGLSRSRLESPPRSPAVSLGLAYGSVMAVMVAIAATGLAQTVPDFFTRAEGTSALREAVLGTTVCEFILAAGCLAVLYHRFQQRFLLWYCVGLCLIGLGLAVIATVRTPGNAFGWLGRAGQYLGGLYMLFAILSVTRRSSPWRISLENALRESEGRYEALVALSPDAILVHSDGRYVYANPAAARLFGARSPRELVGTSVLDLVLPEERDVVARRIREAYGGVTPLQETRLVRLDGAFIYVEIAGAKVEYAGRPAIQIVARDVTSRREADEERKRLVADLEAERALWHATVEAMLDPMTLSDSEGRATYMNPAYSRLVGREIAHGITMGEHAAHYELFHPDGRPFDSTELPLQRAALTGEDQKNVEVCQRGGDGAEHFAIWSAAPLRDAEGRVTGAVAVGHDVTEERRAQREREITIEFLRLVNESTDTTALIHAATGFFQRQSGCEAVGIRLREGDDFPYYETRGFSDKFVLAETSLCEKNASGQALRDEVGDPVMACMCGNVICGRFDPSLPFFTERGSFWTNSTTRLLATTTEADRQARTRNRCNGEGYESVALLPLKVGDNRLGLLQLNDRREGLFWAQTIALWERFADYLAVALAKFRAEEALRENESRYRSLFNGMTEGFAFHELILDDEGRPADYRFLDVNPAFEQLTGLSRETVVGRLVSEVLPGNDPYWLETYAQVVLTGKPAHFEEVSTVLRRRYEVFAYRPEPMRLAAVFMDVTERRRRQDELARLNRTLKALSNSSKAMSRARDEQAYLDEICRIVVEDCGHAMVSDRLRRGRRGADRPSGRARGL